MKKSIIISIKPEWVAKILNGEKTIEIRKSMPKCDFPVDVYIYCCKSNTNLYIEYIECWQYFDGCVAEPFMDYKQLRLTKNHYEEGIEKYLLQKVYRKKLNGKIVAKFTLNKVDKYQVYDDYCSYGRWLKNDDDFLENKEIEELLSKVCLTDEQIEDYCGLPDFELYKYGQETKYGIFYAWHIDNLEIFDKPMELSEFYRNNYLQIIDHLQTVGCDSCYCPHLKDDGCDIMYCPSLKIKKTPQSWCYVYKEVI